MAKKKQMLLIINPRSGREKIRLKLLDILDAYTGAGYQVQVHVTQKALDARDAVLRYGAKKDLIVCSGGDGTLNETVDALLRMAALTPLISDIFAKTGILSMWRDLAHSRRFPT